MNQSPDIPMIDFWRSAIRQQFHAAIDMLANAIKACPDSVWYGQGQRCVLVLGLSHARSSSTFIYRRRANLNSIRRRRSVSLNSKMRRSCRSRTEKTNCSATSSTAAKGWMP